jgi:hypothetical protein
LAASGGRGSGPISTILASIDRRRRDESNDAQRGRLDRTGPIGDFWFKVRLSLKIRKMEKCLPIVVEERTLHEIIELDVAIAKFKTGGLYGSCDGR